MCALVSDACVSVKIVHAFIWATTVIFVGLKKVGKFVRVCVVDGVADTTLACRALLKLELGIVGDGFRTRTWDCACNVLRHLLCQVPRPSRGPCTAAAGAVGAGTQGRCRLSVGLGHSLV